MRKRVVAAVLACALMVVLSTPLSLAAVEVTDPPDPPYYAPVFISGFQLSDRQIDGIELYNESSNPVDLSSWSVQYQSQVAEELCKIALNDWLPPGGYVVLVASDGRLAALADDSQNVRVYDSCQGSLADNFSFTLYNDNIPQETITPTPGVFVRKSSAKTYRTGKFSTDFIALNRSLYAGEWYQPPDLIQAQFSEILVNSRNCSPLEIAIECNDYVKLYNPTDQIIDLSNFRIRNGYLGQSPTTSNTLSLDGLIEPGHFITIPMTVTNSASWLWLEDFYGIKRYDNTVQDYPDGGSDAKKGQAWAYDVIDGLWKWTARPTPQDSPSFFPAPVVETPTPAVTVLAPCKEGQYRSEDTNRCRSVVSAVASLVSCAEGQERNPATNRCRSILGETSTLVPCAEGQERNPETNRCRNIASSIPEAGFAVEPIPVAASDLTAWWAFGGVSLLALGYAGWEWRVEATRLLGRIGSFFHSAK